MNKFFKRLALLLAVLMIVSMMPVQLFADNSVAGEGQSNGTTQNKAVASYELNGETISFEGKTIREVNTEMRKYWEVDDAHGCSYNADRLPADGTGALKWTIYGTVGQGDYLNSGALILPALSGGYIYKNGTYQWENITVVAGDKNATIVSNDTFDVDHIYVSNGANTTTTFTGITLDGSLYVVPNGTVTFDGCVFKGMLRVPNGNGFVKVANCRFVGDADEDSTGKKNEYPFFFQAGGTLEFIGNTIAADTYKRGLNVGGLTGLNATVENNTIGAVTAGYSAIQLSGGVTEAKIKGNKISLNGTNAFTLHGSLISADKVTKVTVEGNTITGTGYLIYDDAAANNNEFTSENLTLTIGTNTVASTVNTTRGVKESVEYDIGETVATVVKDVLTPASTVNGVGYATLADAIAAANGNGTVTLLTATTELVQALLDGQYGSIDGLKIELPTGDYGKLELGRATKYAGSNTEYFVGGFDSTAPNYKEFASADEIRKYKGHSAWTPSCFYSRALNNVTIKAADGATVTIEKISADAGQIYGKENAPKYDYVLDVEIPDTNKSYYMALAWNNVKFEGINFKSSVNIESSSEKTLIDGLHFEKCNFNSGYTELAAANDANKASKGMGIRFVSWTKTTNNLRNLTVNNCTFKDCFEGVYTNPVYGVSVTNSSFNNINHNAVAIQDVDSAVNHGNVVISGNTFTNVSDRIIRFNNVGDGTTITITGNTSVNSGKKDNGEIIKATTMPDSVNVNMTSNTWGDVNGKTAVIGNGFNKVVVATVNGVGYATLADAIANATPDANGTIIYEIYGKATVDSTGWIQVARADLTGLTKVEFVGKTSDAEICITGGLAILADQKYDIDVSFEALTLSKLNPTYGGDYGHSTNYFTTWLRNTNAAENTVTYTNCTFPNGACNNMYGNTVFNGCKFTNATSGKYNLWNYGGNTEIKNSTFTGVRGIKTYNEGTLAVAPTVKIENTTFDGLTEKAAIVTSKATDIALDNVSATNCTEGFFQKDIEYSGEKTTIEANGSAISGNFNITAEKGAAAAKEEFNISAGTFTSEVSSDYLADGFKLKDNGNGTYGVKTAGAVEVWAAYIGPKVASYDTIAEAVANLGKNNWIVITKDYTLTENFVIPAGVYLDIEKGATLTVADVVTLTVAADCKRLGVREGATLINNGTVLVCGTSPHDGGKVVAFDGGTVDLNKLTVPTGYFLDNSGTSYFASIAIFEITYSDGSTKPASADTSWKNAVKVTLLTDVSDFARSAVNDVAENFVLDLGGFILSGKTTASTNVLGIDAPMTIKHGTIKYVSSNTGYGALKTSADVTIDSTATIDGGVGYAIWTDGYDGHTLTVNGTVKSDGSYAITSNGSENAGRIADCSIIVNDSAKIEAPNGIGIYHPELGTVTVNGGTITAHTGIEMCAGKLVVKGGKITSTGANWDATGSQNAILDGAAVSIINRNYPGGIPTAEISGGEFKATGKDAQTIKAYDYKNNTVAEWTNVGESVSVSGGTFSSIPANMDKLCAEGFIPTKNADGTYGVKEATKGSEKNPYTLKELGAMTRAEYIAAQEALGDTMYVEIGDYSYVTNGVLGNGVRNDTPGQTPDHSKLNSYGENGYIGANNDGANGKKIIFVGGSITSGVTGYASIDNIGTSLLLAVPAYTNVTFEGTTFNNVMSFDYQLYTGPWSQLGELKFSGCTFNGLIVGAIAAQTLTFNGCEFKNYTNTISANNSNPTWIRPAYGNWSKGDNDGQGSDFKSLTTINFIDNTVTSTRPVKFERIAQWEMDTKVSVKNNEVTISAQKGDTSTKSVGFYFGANAKFDLTLDGNKKLGATSALYTAVYKAPNGTDYAGLPAGSTVKDSNGADVEVAGVIWKTTDALTLKTTTEAVKVGGVKFATLEEAFAAAKNGDTITLLSDVEMTEIIRVTDSKKITLALNGFNVTITATGKFIRVCNAELTITGNGTIKEQNPYFAPIIIKGGAEGSENYSVVNIKEGVTLEGWAGVMIDQTSGTANNYGMVLNVEGATLNGVNDTDGASGSGIYVNGVVEDAKITLTNTTVTGTGAGMYLAGNADTTINGGSVKGDATGIEIRAGKLTLNNCDVTGGNGEVTATANGNGTTVTNAALAISQHTTKKPIDVTINGGTFNGTAAVYQTDVQGTGSADVKIAVKSGTFNGTISGETDGTITISGGKFKVKVDDKYFDGDHACSTDTTDGYYTVAGHPITGMGLTLSKDISIRIVVDAKYKDGKIKATYETYDSTTKGMVTKELILDKYEYEWDDDGKPKYQFRISNITPQMADVVFTIQYMDGDNEIGSAKQISIVEYCRKFAETDKFEAYKAKIGQLLNYCATAMDFRAVSHKDDMYNGLSWAKRATALRAKISEFGYTVADFDFGEIAKKYINQRVESIVTGYGVEFAEEIKLYFFVDIKNYKEGYTYGYGDNAGYLIPVPDYEVDKQTGEKILIGYRFYFSIDMESYCERKEVAVYDANGVRVQRIGISLEWALKKLYNNETNSQELRQLCKAAYQYFIIFAE